jgi:hypothetical protein
MSLEVDIWYVKLADGDVERITLDELDVAFQNGQIDENSMVLAAGTDQWMKLGELLQAADATPPPPQPTPAPVNAAQPQPHPGAPVVQPMAHPAAMVQQPSPMQAPMRSVMTMAPPALPNGPVANTLRPISFDLEADIQFPRPSGKGKKAVAVLGIAAVLGAATFVVAKSGATSSAPEQGKPAFASAAAALPPAMSPAETATQAAPAPMQASMSGSSSVMDPTKHDPLTDTQKQKLAEADKKVKSHERSHGGGGTVSHSAPAPRSKSGSAAFTTSGNKYDPLNSSL